MKTDPSTADSNRRGQTLHGGSNARKPQYNPDPFGDLSALRLDQSYAETAGVKKLLTTVPVRKPNRQDFVRVHPDPAYRLTPAAIIEVKEDREIYLSCRTWRRNSRRVRCGDTVHRDQPPRCIAPMARQAARLGRKHNEWHRSAAEAAERAMIRWVRVTANMSLGAYEICRGNRRHAGADWPDAALRRNPQGGFPRPDRGSADHPLVRRLRGAV